MIVCYADREWNVTAERSMLCVTLSAWKIGVK